MISINLKLNINNRVRDTIKIIDIFKPTFKYPIKTEDKSDFSHYNFHKIIILLCSKNEKRL